MRGEPFHLGTTMHVAWRTLIQIGIAVWQNVKHSLAAEPEKMANFKATWAINSAFCTLEDTPKW